MANSKIESKGAPPVGLASSAGSSPAAVRLRPVPQPMTLQLSNSLRDIDRDAALGRDYPPADALRPSAAHPLRPGRRAGGALSSARHVRRLAPLVEPPGDTLRARVPAHPA